MFLSSLLLSISLSLDALGVGISYGLRKIKISHLSLTIITIMSMLCFFCSQVLGDFLNGFLPSYVGKIIGSGLIGVIAIMMLFNSFKDDEIEDNSEVALETPKAINTYEALFLSFALSIDSFGAGTGFSCISKLHPMQPLLTGLFQTSFLTLGLYLGSKAINLKWLNKKFVSLAPVGILLTLMLTRIFS